MKRILKIIGIGLVACLGLSILVGIMNAITGRTPAAPSATASPIAVVGLLQKTSPVPIEIPVIEPAAASTVPPTEPAPTALPAATELPTAAALPTDIPAAQEVTIVPGSDSINIRSGPDTNFSVVAALTAGQTAKVIGRVADSTWLQIDQGWVNRGVVIVTGELDQVAIVEAPSAPIVEAPATALPVVDASAPTVVAPVADAPPVVAPVADVPTAAPAPAGNCDPAYEGVCIPSPPPDLNCKDLKQFRNIKVVRHPDPHGLDNDGDGIACEGN